MYEGESVLGEPVSRRSKLAVSAKNNASVCRKKKRDPFESSAGSPGNTGGSTNMKLIALSG